MSNKEGPHDFDPKGIRVLAIDANTVCLSYLVFLLKKCKYGVVGVKDGTEALDELRGSKGKFDIVITNAEQDNIDGFKLLEIIGHEMDIPVIMISADDSKGNVMRGIKHGAIDYILKPVRVQQIKNIWQHVFRRKMNTSYQKSNATREANEPKKIQAVFSSSSASRKKRRMTWTPELHKKFEEAVDKLGNVVHPKKVLELMNEPGLTRDNVASHLQKFRNLSRKQRDDHDLRSNRFCSTLRSQEKINRAFKTRVEEIDDFFRPTDLLHFQDLDFSAYVKNIKLPDEYMRHSNLCFNGHDSRTTAFYAQPLVFGSSPSSQASMIAHSSETPSISDIFPYQNSFPDQQEMQEPLIDAMINTLIKPGIPSYDKTILHSDNIEKPQPSGSQKPKASSRQSSGVFLDDDLYAMIKPFIDNGPPQL